MIESQKINSPHYYGIIPAAITIKCSIILFSNFKVQEYSFLFLSFHFPVTREEPAKDEPLLSIDDYISRGESVLVVDDLKDQLVSDIVMGPGIDGLDTYKKILQLHSGQKAIMASGLSKIGDPSNG